MNRTDLMELLLANYLINFLRYRVIKQEFNRIELDPIVQFIKQIIKVCTYVINFFTFNQWFVGKLMSSQGFKVWYDIEIDSCVINCLGFVKSFKLQIAKACSKYGGSNLLLLESESP